MDIHFVYIIFLENANGHKIGSEFPKYFQYEYGANTSLLLEKALNNNDLTKSEPSDNIEIAKLSIIKRILKQHKLKVSGKKKELVERIKDNLNEKEIQENFPGSFYVLTDKGRNLVNENDHIIYYHKSKILKYEVSIERYDDLLKNTKDPNLKYEVALELLDENARKERKERNWGQYTNSLLAKAYVYEDKNEYKLALDLYLKICLLDSSGLKNGNFYMPKSVMLAPGIIKFIKKLISKLKLDTNDLKKRYYKSAEELNLPKTKLSKETSFKRLIKALK